MVFEKVIELLEADIILNLDAADSDIQSVCSTDLMSDLLHFSSTPRSLLITGLANTQAIRTAEIADIKAVVFVLGKKPDKETIEMARQKGIALLVSRLSRFSACGRLYAAGLKSCTGEYR